jgi:hypothetical protein
MSSEAYKNSLMAGHVQLSIACSLLREALFLRQNGERPPGAGEYPAETWHDWETRTEKYLRQTQM